MLYLFGGRAGSTRSIVRNRLRDELLSGFALAFSALIDDLTVRGPLYDTLVLGETGHTPRLDGDGRGHACAAT
ncbi:DUF1501 domain-containing protein [bacterium]|nr:DUF1501 domain-containing protein [bacterium]